MSSSKSRSELRETIKVALPLIFGQLGQILMNVTDNMMVGPLGAAPLAASAFVNNIFAIPLVFLIGLSTCISVKVSQAYGAGSEKSICRYFWHGLIVCGLSGIIVTCVLLSLTPVIHWFGQPADVNAIAGSYHVAISLSLIPVTIFNGGKMFCDAFSHTVPATIILLFGLIMNAFLNWVLIYGHFGFDPMGITGSGIATLVTRIFITILLFVYIFRRQIYRIYTHELWKVPLELSVFKQLLRVGLPSGMQFLFEVGAFAGAGIMMGWISTTALAAHQIALNLASLSFMVAMGIGYASTVRVGQAMGRQDFIAVRKIGVTAIGFVFSFELVSAALFFILRHWLPTLYIRDVEVVAIAAQLLIVAGLFQIFDGVQAVGAGILRGMADVRVPTLITFFAYWLLALPLAAFLAFYVKLNQLGIWIALASSLVFASGLLVWRFQRLTSNY